MLIFFALLLGFVREVARRNVVPTPSCRRRRVAASSIPASVSTVVPVLSLDPSYIEDEEVSLHDTNLRPRKKKAVDTGADVLVAVALFEDEIVVRETVTIFINEDIRAASEAPTPGLEEIEVVVPLRLKGEEVVVNAFDGDSACPGSGEASSSGPAQEASPTDRLRDKMPNDQGDEMVELDGDDSDSDLDPEDLEMIDSGTTQVEVRIEGGSSTFTLLVNRDLLKYIEDVVHVFDPL